jgi:ribosomal protein S18 acetylase RimI-like enzyme
MIVREATPEDAGGISRVRVDTWRSAYAGLVPQAHLDGLSYEEKEQFFRQLIQSKNECFFVAEQEPGQVIGFASCGPERDGNPVYRGEMYAIYVLEAYQRQGIGHLLAIAIAEKLLHDGYTSMLVWVLGGNKYSRFYECMGGRKICAKKYEISGATLDLTAYGWTDLKDILKPR